MKKSLTYQDTSFIVNAMEYYLADFKGRTAISKDSLNYYREIINTFEKLEGQILQLSVKDKEWYWLWDYGTIKYWKYCQRKC